MTVTLEDIVQQFREDLAAVELDEAADDEKTVAAFEKALAAIRIRRSEAPKGTKE